MNQKNQLLYSSAFFVLLLMLWPVLMAMAQLPGEPEQRFQWIIQNKLLFKVQFGMAFLIAPSLLFMMFSQMSTADSNKKKKNHVLGYIFLAAYLVLCSISYGAQAIAVPALIEQNMLSAARVIYFDSEASFTYFLNQTGYFFWALGTLILFSGYIFHAGPLKTISIIYFLSAALSILAFIGLAIGSKSLNMLTFVSGIILLPAGIISLIRAFRL